MSLDVASTAHHIYLLPEHIPIQRYILIQADKTKFSGANGDREIFIFPVRLTTSRIGNLTRMIRTLLYVMTIHTP